MIGDVTVKLSKDAAARIDALVAAINANTAAIAAQQILPPPPAPCSGDCKAGR